MHNTGKERRNRQDKTGTNRTRDMEDKTGENMAQGIEALSKKGQPCDKSWKQRKYNGQGCDKKWNKNRHNPGPRYRNPMKREIQGWDKTWTH